VIKLPYPPSVNSIWRSTKGGKVYKSADAKSWANEAGWLIKASGLKVKGPFIFSLVATAPDKRRRDIDNISKVVLDALQAAGAIEDDCLCQCIISSWAGVAVSMQMTGDAIHLPVIHVEVG
jgi:crossover junction endodeoxyribonuclease RusA